MSQTWKLIKEAFLRNGGAKYMISEPITQTEHALQSYVWMKTFCARKEMQAAAFLHDIGHLIIDTPINPLDGQDDRHEITGANWLSNRGFPSSVCMPVMLHVQAKRYLCFTNKFYRDKLSGGSRLSLDLQGGPMTPHEAISFSLDPWFREALFLRQADEEGKQMGVDSLPNLDSLEELILEVLE